MLKCKYCGSGITKRTTKCPNCGADLTDVIEEQDKKIKEEFDKRREHIAEEYNKFSSKMAFVFICIGVFILLIFGYVIFSFTRVVNNSSKDKDKIVETSFNKEASAKDLSVTCDNLQEYDMIADFDGYTDSVKKDGYQQIAFHIKIKNTSDKRIDFFLDNIEFVLLADEVQMIGSSVKEESHFRYEVSGKKFESLPSSVAAGATVEGWIGFYVKKDAKELELRVGNVSIKMDNPVFKG